MSEPCLQSLPQVLAGPILRHIKVNRLALWMVGSCSLTLRMRLYTYFHREKLLPDVRSNQALTKRFFRGAKKPIFTTANAHNHLISLNEVMAMYLLVWSPVCWRLVTMKPPVLSAKDAATYQGQQAAIDDFVAGLPRASRALAHLPTYMIFDDHDVTDDWNLSAL